MIWEATGEDIFGLIEMGRRFHRGADLPGVFVPATFAGFCEHLIKDDDGVVFRSERGMIGGLIGPAFWDNTYRIANETFWWSEDNTGRALMQKYEEWARPRADEVRMAMLMNLRPVATSRALRDYEAVEMGMVRKW